MRGIVKPTVPTISKEEIEEQISQYVSSDPNSYLFVLYGMSKRTIEWRRGVLMEYVPFIIKFFRSNVGMPAGDGKIHDFIYHVTRQTPETYTSRDVPKTLAKIEYARRFLEIHGFLERDRKTYDFIPTERLFELENVMFL